MGLLHGPTTVNSALSVTSWYTVQAWTTSHALGISHRYMYMYMFIDQAYINDMCVQYGLRLYLCVYM